MGINIYPLVWADFHSLCTGSIGAKFNVNIVYPLQLTLGAEYILNFNLNKIKDNDNTKSNAERFFFDPTGYKRNGLNIYAGLRFNF